MGRIVELSPSISFEDVMAAKGAGSYKPDFRIFTAGIESDRKSDRLVHMVGSSTEKDLQGDSMSILALQSMTKAAPNLTVWLNHNYDLPDSIFGSISQVPSIYQQNGIADLHLDVDVELENPAAARVKRYIDNGRRLGCSIGCMVTKYEVEEDEDAEVDMWGMKPITIHEVYVVEYSVVGIPANQRSWVENAIRGVFTRTLDKALVPAMKALWPSAYKEAVKGIAFADTRRQYDALPARPTPGERLDWHAMTKTFVLSGGTEKPREIDRTAVQQLLNGAPYVPTAEVKLFEEKPLEELEEDLLALNIEDVALTEKGANHTKEGGHSMDLKSDELRAINKDGTQGVLLKAGGKHVPYKGTHSHLHDAVGHGDNADHTHEHTHDGDDSHGHDHKGVPTAVDARSDAEKAKDPDNDGDDDTTAKGDTDHDQGKGPGAGKDKKPVKAVQPAHVATVEIDATKQQLLASYNGFGHILGLPEVTAEMLSQGTHPASTPPVEEASYLEHFTRLYELLETRIGKAKPDEAMSLQYAETRFKTMQSGFEQFSTALDTLTEVMKVKGDVTATLAGIEAAKVSLAAIQQEATRAAETVAHLKSMPLGNPVHQTRSVTTESSAASHAQMLGTTNSQQATLAIDSLSQALGLTELWQQEYANGQLMRYRRWPAGVGGSTAKGVRPPLTTNQISYMAWDDIVAYRDGGDASVPYIDNQVDNSPTVVTPVPL